MPGPTYCQFGNTIVSRGFDFTYAPGVEPSVCMLYTVPHTSTLPNVGTLQFQTEGQTPFTFRDCLLESPRLAYTKAGQQWVLPIKDRRWKWQWGNVYGHFNKPEANLTYTREKTPQELAGMLLNVLNETAYDVSRLPNTTRPEKRWDGSPAAAELDQLCAELGCIVTLNHLTDKVEIWPIGEGGALPSGGTVGGTDADVYPAQPERLKVEGGETLFQATFATEAVGLDTDGRWKRLADLSYYGGGFDGGAAVNGFVGLWENLTYVSGGRTLYVRDLAAATVFRCYRVTGLMQGGFSPPLLTGTFQEPSSLKDLRLSQELVDEEISSEDGGLRPLPSVVLARYADPDNIKTLTLHRYPHGFSFDAEHCIVQFNEPLYTWEGGNNHVSTPAEIRYECAFNAGANGVYHRQGIISGTGSSITTPMRLIQRNDIQARITYRYSTAGNLIATEGNTATADADLGKWRDAAMQEYGLQDGQTVTYEGLKRITVDGLTQQITWSGGGQKPATTTASQAQRHNRFIEPPDEVRARLAQKRIEAFQAIQQAAVGQLARVLGGGV